jgi:hypothetical protein
VWYGNKNLPMNNEFSHFFVHYGSILCNWIFVGGWFVSAYLFGLQLKQLIKTKQYQGVSVNSSVGFFLMNVNGTI